MKRISKVLSSLTLLLLLAALLAGTVLAAPASITFQGFTAGFTFAPGSEYTETDLFDDFKNVMPGDTLTQEITFTNAATDCDFVNVYMRALAHDAEGNPLSPSVAATGETEVTMADFLAQLSMRVWNGSELLYEASPDELDGLREEKCIGTFRTGESATLTVELEVPLTLGNAYANRTGEVDWLFRVDAYNESQLSVRKVWSDGNDRHAGESVTVNLLKDGAVERQQELNAENGWAYTFDRLQEGFEWTVEEDVVPDGYTVRYETDGTLTTIINTLIPPPEEKTERSVEKIWVNNGHHQPDGVTVQLLRGSEVWDTVILNDANGWYYRWQDLSANAAWSVREIPVPDGYYPVYTVTGTHTTITNYFAPDIPPDVPGSDLTVRKVWEDGDTEHPDSVQVELLRNGRYDSTVTLDARNGWSHTWTGLDGRYNWSVSEIVPDGYEARYDVSGSVITIYNTREEPAGVTGITVRKLWSGDETLTRPDMVTVTLYDGAQAVQTVVLNSANGWSYRWTDLDAKGNWQIIETNIPAGYTPSYFVQDGVVTITNTATLIRTGQQNRPFVALAAAGLVLLAAGALLLGRKKRNHA